MKYSILVIDDSKTTRAVLVKTLTILGIPANQIFEAPNGRVALDIIEKNQIDLIFSDVNMPIMNGKEMLEELRQNSVHRSVPVVIVSMDCSYEKNIMLKEMGVRAFIRKPFTPEMLRGVINEILGDNYE
jgi:two-component system, chemotaxis family, chemotaxis protein CheY